ncbi:ribosomal protein S18-alanine N-acetyltransferase [Microbacterium sp. No. 7]|uniref:ribosomal protein S18-alanine N-acetyltransferase n=1 Tax=Microbacterium sp. No. 7 TaxID=1714373 RepID=UPI0009E7758A|nr:ribosomal protein S18-alanine N-acetyltransferase [Microbacterium sp. No. 7]
MSLRTATPDDLADIMALERASFPTDAWSEAMMAEELASPHGTYLVDVGLHGLVGYGGVRAVRGAADADIQTIAIAAAARGRGRGRALLTALLAAARERGARDMFLEVRADNPVAEALYASVGFTEIGRRPRYYQPDDVDAVVMRLDLAAWAAASAPASTAFPAPTSEDPTNLGASGEDPSSFATFSELRGPGDAADAAIAAPAVQERAR